MKKITHLRLCNRLLLLLTAAMLASGIQLEASDCEVSLAVYVHIAVGLVFFSLVARHIYLHFGRSNWFARFSKQKNHYTRVLWWVTLAAFISGTAACLHWLASPEHSPLGGIHGKIGFVMILLAAGHIIKRFKFFRVKK
ncbi:MAG: hypothetical protein K2L21_02145 [Muribaculaceae bacterium]|nr:hypothetical protein [Muribaculaceae bacterium]